MKNNTKVILFSVGILVVVLVAFFQALSSLGILSNLHQADICLLYLNKTDFLNERYYYSSTLCNLSQWCVMVSTLCLSGLIVTEIAKIVIVIWKNKCLLQIVNFFVTKITIFLIHGAVFGLLLAATVTIILGWSSSCNAIKSAYGLTSCYNITSARLTRYPATQTERSYRALYDLNQDYYFTSKITTAPVLSGFATIMVVVGGILFILQQVFSEWVPDENTTEESNDDLCQLTEQQETIMN